ncbi:Tectonic-3 [Terramyces sp. JEL0728]|nr:Tectonic-3 [Terramyces sp. JEL0728]
MANIIRVALLRTALANAILDKRGSNQTSSVSPITATNSSANITQIAQSTTTIDNKPSTVDTTASSTGTSAPDVIFVHGHREMSDFNETLGIVWSNAVTSKPLTNWNRDISICSCDLTFNQCDPNCCCDTDCMTNGDEASYFTGCQTTAQTVLPFCSSYLDKVTWADGVKIKTIPALGGGLCVVYVNCKKGSNVAAVKGDFFEDVGTFTDDTSFTTQYKQGLYLTSRATYDVVANISVLAYKDPSATSSPVPITTSFMCIDPITNVATSSCSSLPTSPSPTLSNGVCSNMVVEVALVFTYQIVTSVLTLTALDMTIVFDSQTFSNSIKQTFSVQYVAQGATNVYSRSGNPGYIYGLPVLAGLQVSQGSANAISMNADPQFGITLLKDVAQTSTVGCPNTLTDYGNRSPVTFGENTISGCTLWLTRNDLLNNCDSLRSRIYNLQTLTARNIDSVGMFGNASTTNVFDWIKIINNPPSAITGAVSSPGTSFGICSNLLTSFNVEFLYSSYGSTTHPQHAIVGARYSYTPGTFGWTCDSVRDCVDPNIYSAGTETITNIGTASKPFQLSSTVSFVQVSTLTSSLYIPPPPKIYAELPDDIWYPFSIPT